jgi:hydroxyacylglutathione hydrolase
MTTDLQIIPIPAFEDNYIWLLHDGQDAIVVDPGDAAPVTEYLAQHQLNLKAILITHHHSDHIDGVATLQSQFKAVQTYAPSAEQYSFDHKPVSESDKITIKIYRNSIKIVLQIIDLPGHTLGHIAYKIVHQSQSLLFCGDTLFGAGCGRLFEGTPNQMQHSLKKLALLPAETKVYCTHEYTAHNINFALTIEPNNKVLMHRKHETTRLRQLNQPSLPSTIGLELATNPFLRCTEIAIKTAMGLENASELQIFTELRLRRNDY